MWGPVLRVGGGRGDEYLRVFSDSAASATRAGRSSRGRDFGVDNVHGILSRRGG